MTHRRFVIVLLTLAALLALPATAWEFREDFLDDYPYVPPGPPAPPPPPPPTTFEFRVPSGVPSPFYRSSTVTVPGNDVFVALAEGEADFRPVFESALRAADGVRSLTYLRYQFPQPRFTLSGEGTSVIATISGFTTVNVRARIRPDKSIVRLLCGSNVRADLNLTHAAIAIRYDFLTGEPVDVDIQYATLSTGYDCNRPIIGEIAEFLNDIFEFADVQQLAIDALDDGEVAAEDALNGRFANRFALQDLLDDVSEAGPREIREAAEEAVRLLGGLRSAVAAFIADAVTEDLIDRLNLQTEAQIDALLARLDGLEEFIAAGLPGLSLMDWIDLNSASFDWSDYLDAELPYVEDFLYDRLNRYYANVTAAIRDLEIRAIDAVEAFVNADFSRLFGGVNARLTLYRDTNRVLIEAFHDAPSPFIGRAEAVSPCFPTYTIPAVENAAEYRLYNSLGNVVYQGTGRTHTTWGLLSRAIATNHFGLHSYAVPARLELFGWGDVDGGRGGFRMPLCPIAGEPRIPNRPPPPPPAPPPPPPTPPPTLPPGDDCGRGRGGYCP